MCSCCHSTPQGMRQYTRDFEPIAEVIFDDSWESELTSVSKVKERLHKFIQDQSNSNRVPLCINPSSAAFKSFASSTVAHPSELPPSPTTGSDVGARRKRAKNLQKPTAFHPFSPPPVRPIRAPKKRLTLDPPHPSGGIK